MAVFDTTTATRGTAHGANPVTHLFRGVFGSFIQWNDARVTRNALERLTSHELDDIGLTPGDIDRLTRR